MPRKNKTPEVKLLLRDNQRRSRARRRELFDDMQRRLQAYERDGVHATLEMQAAARAVAAENVALRTLLFHYGVSETEVKEHLLSSGLVPGHSPDRPLEVTFPLSGSEYSRRQLGQIVDQKVHVGSSPNMDAHDRLVELAGPEEPAGSAGPVEPVTSMHMDCNVAASIVADVQGHGDPSLARSALGCNTLNCSVTTTRVFEIIDRAT